MRYRYAKYGYYIPGSAFTVATYCPHCHGGSTTTVLGDGSIQIQCERCGYDARYDSYESLRRCFRRRERAAVKAINEHCEYSFDSAEVAFQYYMYELARRLDVPARAASIRYALARIPDTAERAELQARAETRAWYDYQNNCLWCEELTPLVRYYFAQLRNHYGY